MTLERRRCEILHAEGRAEEAAEVLRQILKKFDKDISASKETEA